MNELRLRVRANWVTRTLHQSRFWPEPPAIHHVGMGNFKAIGIEFLGYLMRLTDLEPEHSVLDIGCGLGRLAIPLAHYQGDQGKYLGLDPHQGAIDWCRREITSRYPAFRFEAIDIQHPIYNPTGALCGADVTLPVADATIDRVCLISVLTHLPPDEVERMLRETARVLRPGGLALVTVFSLTVTAMASMAAGRAHMTLHTPDGKPAVASAPGDSPEVLSIPRMAFLNTESPMEGVGYRSDYLAQAVASAGLEQLDKSQEGRWSGGTEQGPFQDMLILKKP